ncbi:hypothetical protein [Kamptonema formosum]|uniref:hypothetical protein n=1 Tax=Kamptonema formosum TaxID=331992 RepID=UPI00034A7545|nr:hypothetical protein [Oscillatoria sp. PCC 10802]
MIDCILNLESWESLIHVMSCVLEDIASEVLEVRMMLRNKCPWAKFVCKGTGRRWATFIARAKFQGFLSIPFPGFSWPKILSSCPLLKSLSH